MSNSAIYMANTGTQTVAATNGVLNLGRIVRRFGCAVDGNSDEINVKKCGYYFVTANVTFTADTTGDVTIAVQSNGSTVTGLTASNTVATAITEINSVSISGIVRSTTNALNLTLVNTGAIAITPSNVAVSVIKL